MGADLHGQLQAALSTTFTIERELAGGGMSRVFLAEELALGRHVVIKVLPPELGGDASAERFSRETQSRRSCSIRTSCRSSRLASRRGSSTTRCRTSRESRSQVN